MAGVPHLGPKITPASFLEPKTGVPLQGPNITWLFPQGIKITWATHQTQIGMTSSSGAQNNGIQYPGAQGNLTNNMFTGSSSGYNNQLNPFSPQYRSNVTNNPHFLQPLNRGDSQGFRKVTSGVQPPWMGGTKQAGYTPHSPHIPTLGIIHACNLFRLN